MNNVASHLCEVVELSRFAVNEKPEEKPDEPGMRCVVTSHLHAHLSKLLVETSIPLEGEGVSFREA